VMAWVRLSTWSSCFARGERVNQWKKALIEGASDIFERGRRKEPAVDEAMVKELHAKIGELAVANDFLSRKLKPWAGG